MMITLEAIFRLLAIVIMLFPSAIYLLRWLHRRYGTSNNQSDPCHDPVLSQMSSSAGYGQFEDIEMQLHTRSLGHYKRSHHIQIYTTETVAWFEPQQLVDAVQ